MKRTKLSANRDWTFFRGAPPTGRIDAVERSDALEPWDPRYDDGTWESVCLPHTVREENLMCSGGFNYQGESWYRRRFTLPAEFKGADLFFELEGAMQRVDAWLDGEPLGFALGGFLPAGFDLTGLEPETEHLLALRVDNSDMPDVPPGKPQGALDFCYFGGLYRDAWLHAANKVRFSRAVHEGKPASGGLFIRSSEVNAERATVTVNAHWLNRGETNVSAKVRLLLDGKAVFEGEEMSVTPGKDCDAACAFTVEQPRLWHPDHPDLYTVTAQLIAGDEVLDEVSERIGIRAIEFRVDGFYINGEKLFLNGANRHQEYAYVGFAIPDALQKRDVQLLRSAGINCVRLGHYPQDTAFMDACDELGVLCVIPTPGWQIHPQSVVFDEASYENTRRLIRMNRNHASAMLWEPILNETDYPEYFARKQLQIVKQEMNDENALCACDSHYAYAKHYPVIYSHRVVPGKPRFVREYGDQFIEQFGPMRTLRRVRRGENVSFYPGGERAMIRSAREHYEAYVSLRLDPNVSGGAMWAGIDHNRGYEENEAAVGMLDILRLPKFSYALYDAQQSVERAGAKCFIADYWTENSPRDVNVYTNAPAVRLLLNGREIGVLTGEGAWAGSSFGQEGKARPEGICPPIVFENVPWERGLLTAEALVDGEVAARHSVTTPGEPVALTLVPNWAGAQRWTADGADLLMIHVSVVDEDGTVAPNAEPEIRFCVEGGAFIVGEGKPWVCANPAKAEAGMTGVLLRAGKEPGRVVLRASADGLKDAEIELITSPDEREALPGPVYAPPERAYVYPVDRNERFSARQSLKLESFYRWDMGKDKPAEASSCAEGSSAQNANRGKIGEPWIAGSSALPQWWQCDMEEPCWLYGASITWLNDGLWYDYEIETSLDGELWERQAEGRASGQSQLPSRFAAPVWTRHARITVRGVTGDEPVGIYQVELHGDQGKEKLDG